MKYIAVFILALFVSTPVMAEEQCQVFSDGVIVCYPTGGYSTYGK